jgi:ABC-type antimicrobial peptide transport system permease subunit
VGIAASLGADRFVATLLYGVSLRDPVTIVGVAALLALVGLAASYIPARRATRINPVTALRYE